MSDSESPGAQVPAAQAVPHGYSAALDGAVFLPRMDVSILTLLGPDRVDFLQRQSTNNLALLAPDRAVQTVLTTAKARILDVLTLVIEGETLLAVTLPGRGPATATFLRSRIFFMDDVRVEDPGPERAIFDLEGPVAGQILAASGVEIPPQEDEVRQVEIAGAPSLAVGRRGLSGPGYRLLVPTVARGEVIAWLRAAGAEPLSPEAYLALRIEAGRPEAGYELMEAYTPLEAGLRHLISADKGCYTGQEVIARQLTYDKITHHLVGLQLTAGAAPGDPIHAEGRAAGTVTSAAESPRFGPIALGIVRRPHHEPGTAVMVGAEGAGGSARVVPLPFEA